MTTINTDIPSEKIVSFFEYEKVDAFYKKMADIDNESKTEVLYKILDKPKKKNLNTEVISDLLNDFFSMNELQRREVISIASGQYDLSKNVDKWHLFAAFDGSKFMDKIKLKLIGNKEISSENIKSLSNYFFDRGIMKNFESYNTSDLLIASGNLRAVQFLTTHNNAYKKPEVLERMLMVANIQKQNEIASYISDNFELKITKVIDGKIKTVSVMVPDKNKVLSRMVVQPSSEKNQKNTLKVK